MDRAGKEAVLGLGIMLLMVMAAMLGIYAGVRAIDEHFDNQDTMLCHSAKVSENTEYLVKCKCYYEGEDIRCIYKENK